MGLVNRYVIRTGLHCFASENKDPCKIFLRFLSAVSVSQKRNTYRASLPESRTRDACYHLTCIIKRLFPVVKRKQKLSLISAPCLRAGQAVQSLLQLLRGQLLIRRCVRADRRRAVLISVRRLIGCAGGSGVGLTREVNTQCAETAERCQDQQAFHETIHPRRPFPFLTLPPQPLRLRASHLSSFIAPCDVVGGGAVGLLSAVPVALGGAVLIVSSFLPPQPLRRVTLHSAPAHTSIPRRQGSVDKRVISWFVLSKTETPKAPPRANLSPRRERPRG